MARQKEFDREAAIASATQIFWGRSYEATTTSDLLNGMQIARQSLYDTFGDKHRLYIEALRRYSVGNIREFSRLAKRSPSPLAAIRTMLLSVAEGTEEARARGCLGVQSVCDFGGSDPEVMAIGQMASSLFRETLAQVLCDAKKANELPDKLDEHKAAKTLHAFMLGLRVRARAGDGVQDLRDAAECLLDGWLHN
ncbi:TetR/AcrR family transcriptional regulator [Rhizobium aegyptiacum]|uniref:TetR/AcrR family transcriptional regulator n=1 Tax=Rhizobium aegyptiacum TaxID=1764550 RepID=UPI0007E5AFE8|nr:TetR family transcriptional regulator [Rhizobium aegyptiacum]